MGWAASEGSGLEEEEEAEGRGVCLEREGRQGQEGRTGRWCKDALGCGGGWRGVPQDRGMQPQGEGLGPVSGGDPEFPGTRDSDGRDSCWGRRGGGWETKPISIFIVEKVYKIEKSH